MMKKIKDLFGIDAPDTAMYPVESERTHRVPKLDPHYKFSARTLRVVLLWLQEGGSSLYLSGPTGAGKTTLIEQVCARIGRETYRVGCHSRLEISDMVGRLTLTADGTKFVYGPLVESMRRGGVLLLDEADQLPPSTAMGLTPILDRESIYIPETGEWVEPHPNFRVAVTGNSAGRGDETGLYRGVQRQNLAWVDRFFHLHVSYMKAEDEVEIIRRAAPDLPEVIARAMVRLAEEVRKVFIGCTPDGTLESTISTRVLVRWARTAVSFYGASGIDPLEESLHVSLLNSLSERERDSILSIWRRINGGDSNS